MPQATPVRAEPASGSDFAPLLRQVRAAGLLERRRGRYALTVVTNLLALAATATGIVLTGDSWWTLLLALPAAVFSARTAFIGHDSGHSQIAVTRRANRLLGLVHADLLLGMSYGWWNDKHNRHHANPNHVDKDPDVGVGALVWTQRQAAARAGFTRWLTRHQAALFFPLLLLEGVNLKVSSLLDLKRREAGERRLEATLLLLHAAGYATLLLSSMSPGKALAFGLLHHALFGLHLGMVFAPNHKGMEMPDPDGERWGHLRRQVLTSRNVRGGPVTDWFMGGLNYQIEHHLFPSMPRPHLRLARPLVRAHCRTSGLTYAETGLIDSYRQALLHMHEVGAPLRAARGTGQGLEAL
ncbi:acyl-CoA desaturase [Streptomyces cinnamoneus]|uniref:Acyl-CoA desaturase n=1 Tax=Streptomyces cinnamoneus TaxID=53446 RepID=A0A2G1XMW4_STRCJ|nr:acyl-CoA desaturase [Streptomyces cinnamoneus]PHQ52550.1 acyl-CoA desaturase [Streptomyces cinnamoneus]PPT16088.1 acyl-CoA desaturase [Streptomyces cinnamoneus]